MKDTIIKGTGNSRYLKSGIPSDITHSQLVQQLRDGTFPIDLNGVNPAGIEQLGTPLNTSTLLSNETAAALGLGADATVDEAFAEVNKIFEESVKLYTDADTETSGGVSAGTMSLPYAAASPIVKNSVGIYVYKSDGGGTRTYPCYSADGETFSPASSTVAIGKGGGVACIGDTFVLVGVESSGSYEYIKAFTSTTGATWSTGVQLDRLSDSYIPSVLAVVSSGSVVTAFVRYNNSIYWYKTTDGTTWTSGSSVATVLSSTTPQFGYGNNMFWVKYVNSGGVKLGIKDASATTWTTVTPAIDFEYMVSAGADTYGFTSTGALYRNTSSAFTNWQLVSDTLGWCPTMFALDGSGGGLAYRNGELAYTVNLQDWVYVLDPRFIVISHLSYDNNGSFMATSTSVAALNRIYSITPVNEVTRPLLNRYTNEYPCVEIGSYVGTGTSGANNPNELTFSIYPEVVIVGTDYQGTNYETHDILVRPFLSFGQNIFLRWGSNFAFWWTTSSSTDAATYQRNTSGKTYYYIAFGKALTTEEQQ